MLLTFNAIFEKWSDCIYAHRMTAFIVNYLIFFFIHAESYFVPVNLRAMQKSVTVRIKLVSRGSIINVDPKCFIGTSIISLLYGGT